MASKTQQKSIGLALSGGGVRACVHIGVYEVLQANNIKISHIAGTSMGAIIGAAIAMGISPITIKKFLTQYNDLNLFKLSNFNYFNEGIIKRDKINEILSAFFGDKTFDSLKIPFVCTAIDLESHQEIVFSKGPLKEAISASSSYPVIFPPLFYQERYLVDGGVKSPLPVVHARKLAPAEPLLAIQIKTNTVRQYLSGEIYLKHYKKPPLIERFWEKPFRALRQKKADIKLLLDIMLETINIGSELEVETAIKEAKPELILTIDADISLLDFSKVDEAISLGRKLAEDNLEKIKSLTAA